MNENNLKQCIDCNQNFLKSEFYKNCSYCKKCLNIRQKIWVKNNPEQKMLSDAKTRAKISNIEFDLKKDDIIIPEYCPVLGIKLQSNRENKKNRNNSPSLDRIDNEKGYTKENIMIISWRANKLKNNGTLEEFEAIVNYMKKCK